MKQIVLVAVMLLMCCGATAYADHDNLGRPLTTEGVLGGAEASTDVKHYFDLAITLGAAGANDDSSGSEMAIAEVALLFMPPTDSGWLKLGVAMGWNGSDRSKIDFSTPVYFTIFPNPLSSVRYGFRVRPFTFSVRTDPDAAGSSSWSFDPGGAFVVEFPMGGYSLAANVGAQYVFSQEGESVNAPSVGAGVTLFFRLGR